MFATRLRVVVSIFPKLGCSSMWGSSSRDEQFGSIVGAAGPASRYFVCETNYSDHVLPCSMASECID